MLEYLFGDYICPQDVSCSLYIFGHMMLIFLTIFIFKILQWKISKLVSVISGDYKKDPMKDMMMMTMMNFLSNSLNRKEDDGLKLD